MGDDHFVDFRRFKREVSRLNCRRNIRCLLFYGTILKKCAKVNDVDVIVVLKDIKSDSSALFELLFKEFENVDFHVYSIDEIEGGLSYFTREYITEYLSKGYCIYGENVFKTLYKKVTRRQYRRSILIRSIEHVQMVRKVLFSKKYSLPYKYFFLRKYIIRLSKNILLFKRIMNYDDLSVLTDTQILSTMKSYGLIPVNSTLSPIKSRMGLVQDFRLFCDISSNLITCKKELGMFSFL